MTGRGRRQRLLRAAQALAAVALLAVLLTRVGTAPIGVAATALTPAAAAGALALGGIGALAQGLRWRLVAAGLGDRMPHGVAVARCYEAAFLNAVLPTGIAGDALRAARRRLDHDRPWGSAVWSVIGERLCGTAVAAGAAAAGLATLDTRLAAVAAAVAVGAAVAASRALRPLPARARAAAWGLSVLGWAAYLGLFLLAAAAVGTGRAIEALLALGAVTVGGMSVPLSLAGWGPREGAATLAFAAAGAGAALGLAVSVAYGLLALVSVAPGGLLLLVGLRRPGPQHQLGADVVPEKEPA